MESWLSSVYTAEVRAGVYDMEVDCSALILLALALAQDDPATFKSTRTEVRLDVQVLKAKRPLTNLTRTDFKVEDENNPVQLTYFAHESEPLSLVLLLDISGSMRQFIDRMSKAARQAIETLRPGDRVAVMVYGRRPQLHLDFTADFAPSPKPPNPPPPEPTLCRHLPQ